MNTIKTSILFLIILFSLFVIPSTTFAIEYQSLAPIGTYVKPEFSITPTSFSDYLNNMFKLGIALCTALAVLMIIVGGIQYASSDAWSKKSDGKERIFAALTGLVIALGSWALLNTIDPRLVSTALTLKEVKIEGIEEKFAALDPAQKEYVQTGKNTGTTDNSLPAGGPGATPTGNHVAIPSEINNQASGKKIDSSMAQGLQNMNTELKAAGINWTITEAYPQSREHKADCHRTGTCIDADFLGGDTPANIKKFIEVANNNGFRAVWEVKTQKEKDTLVAAGVPEARVKALGNWISGSHFSVYNK
jgi:hypothetical protein